MEEKDYLGEYKEWLIKNGIVESVERMSIRHKEITYELWKEKIEDKRNKSFYECIMSKTICKWFGHHRNNWWIGRWRPKYCSRCHEYLGK